jgi:uncharacterized MnhB-related membrane protein
VTPLQLVILLLVAAGGTAVVAARDPRRQVIVNGIYGLLLVVLFLVFQAPDVALSALVVGAVGAPLIILITLAKVGGGGSD